MKRKSKSGNGRQDADEQAKRDSGASDTFALDDPRPT